MDIKKSLISVGEGVVGAFDILASGTSKLANKAIDKHVCIGVTGFSGSGC